MLAAAVTTMLREGDHVPVARIADEAGVGVGTLYRRYPHRDTLLAALTERSFTLVLALVEKVAAESGPGVLAVDRFLEGTIEHRDHLVLPLHGGPATLSAPAASLRADIAEGVDGLLRRGRDDRTIREDLTAPDVILFGAMLAQPLPNAPDWAGTARRQKEIFLAGIVPGPGRSRPDSD